MQDNHDNQKRTGRYTKRQRSKLYYFRSWLKGLTPGKKVLLGIGIFLIIAIPISASIVIPRVIGTDEAQEVASLSLKDKSAVTLSSETIGTVAATPEPTATPEPEPTPTPEPDPTNTVIKYGMEFSCVYAIQERLMELGFMEEDEPTNYFGSITEKGVKLFQRQVGFEDTGCVDAQTWAAMCAEDAPTYTVMQDMDGIDVTELQKRLRDLGYMDEITGHFGEITVEAVKKFQENNDLSSDGKVGMKTREILYSEDAVANFFKYGEESDEIKDYQTRLKKLGYLTTTPDGNYGKDTVAAVKRFQEVNGLTADGFLGYNTINALMSSDALSNALKLGMEGDDVTSVQKYLKNLGYLSKVTGYYGSMTEEAVKAFQKRNSLSVDGTVGKNTMSVLTSSKAKKAASSSSSSSSSTSKSSSSSSGNTATSSANSSSVERFIAIAESKLGCTYVFGSKGPSTFDCSGFVYYCLNQAGVSQGYMTSSGWAKSTKYPKVTSMSKLERGDIIVYSGHVAIYLGGGSMIDASSSKGKVRKTSGILSSSYWTSHFICGFRVF